MATRSLVYLSLSSLADPSLDFQLTICQHYCQKRGLRIESVVREYGKITLLSLSCVDWKALLAAGVCDFVFYELVQLEAEPADLFDSLGNVTVRVHFAKEDLVMTAHNKDSGLFRGTEEDRSRAQDADVGAGTEDETMAAIASRERRAARSPGCTLPLEVRNSLRDLVVLVSLTSCKKRLIADFVMEHFSGFGELIKLLKSHVALVTRMLDRYSFRRSTPRPARGALGAFTFARFLANIKHLRMLYDERKASELAGEIARMSLVR
ncbi:nonfunctional serine recombinase [Eastern grey kangaroopox virus]|uniref:Protein OPG061 n=1 Tax=Eastern grey kangaroopox virus TaxID=2042482 RepID=A0A2C9DT03_9POXV|nr:nonfunctional serine recombinase [Eastern grey kangaroopox virus]ATI21136.1 nonfunctional serine recombinase [Eastern grey kangaroopox virus]ATX75037.1 nonfunctional serine recombinase [Eastern grey kangaroopox virus]